MEEYFTFNKEFDISLIKNGILVKSLHEKEEFVLHGDLTSKILLPSFKYLFYPTSIKKLSKITGCEKDEILKVLRFLIEKNILISHKHDFYIDTYNHYSKVGFLNKKFHIAICLNLYMSQLDMFDNVFKKIAYIDYIFINLDISKDKFASQLHGKSFFVNRSNIYHFFSKRNYNLIIDIQYGYKYDEYINYSIERYSNNNNIPIIYSLFNGISSWIGPFYFPNKTASFSDLMMNDICVHNKRSNFFINPLITIKMIAYIINDSNWLLFRLNDPIFLDNIVFISNKVFLQDSIHIYKKP